MITKDDDVVQYEVLKSLDNAFYIVEYTIDNPGGVGTLRFEERLPYGQTVHYKFRGLDAGVMMEHLQLHSLRSPYH